MRGDLSTRLDVQSDGNDVGVLWQQGRVFLDADGNAQTRLAAAWQTTAARDVIGFDILAVPADQPDAFHVDSATVDATGVRLEVDAGHGWASGILVHETGGTRTATYFEPPVQVPAAVPGTIANGIRDAVVLEVWHESLSAFQEPARLLEPALGGVDTTGRLRVAAAYRLLRLGPNDDCNDVLGLLGDESGKGRLTVTLLPRGTVGDPCPVEVGGGYTGFEHQLYRIEIARVSNPALVGTQFKWSRFNGGLVGRGVFNAATQRVDIRANLQAITTSGLNSFYLEAVEWNAQAGRWVVTYGATVALAGDQLVLPAVASFGAVPPAGPPATPNVVFFRLWDALRPISAFPIAPNPTELADGIRLAFDADAAGRYVAEDYWTFQVRAADITNAETLVNNELPHGIRRTRVPVAILNWTGGAPTTITAAAANIRDCRVPFHPLTRLGNCCTYRVGDGVRSHGDFDSIQAAINALPAGGGKICLLPGLFTETVLIENRRAITISGCGRRTLTGNGTAGGAPPTAPVFTIRDSSDIRFDHFVVGSPSTHPAILIVETAPHQSVLPHVQLANLGLSAGDRSAIEVQGASGIVIRECDIWMNDVASPWPAIFLRADDVLVERNTIQVLRFVRGVQAVLPLPEDQPFSVSAGRGGIQIAGTSDRVRITDNLIRGGIGNGITLGSFRRAGRNPNDPDDPWVIDVNDPCSPCRPGDVIIVVGGDPNDPGRTVSAGALTDIRIERNRILDMGLAGIGVAGFFDLAGVDEMIWVDGLIIEGNRIRRCLNRPLAPIPSARMSSAGYGAICLADVTRLVVRGNEIDNNGRDRHQPVCGIFVLHGEGIDIAHNRITGPVTATQEPDRGAADARRGGINIVYCIPPTIPTRIENFQQLVPVQSGEPALRVHDNIVAVPLGQALSVSALGPVTVQGNQFTTHGVTRSDWLAATVVILNLGVSNELYGQPLFFSYGALLTPTSLIAETTFADGFFQAAAMDDFRLGHLFGNGNVLFTDNQCVLSLLQEGFGFALTSVAILTLDDVGFNDNQCDCDLFDDFVIIHTAVIGASVRVTDNRFKEGALNTVYSALTMGLLMNITAHNQSTHCLLITGPSAGLLSLFGETVAGKRVDAPNVVLFDDLCVRLGLDVGYQPGRAIINPNG